MCFFHMFFFCDFLSSCDPSWLTPYWPTRCRSTAKWCRLKIQGLSSFSREDGDLFMTSKNPKFTQAFFPKTARFCAILCWSVTVSPRGKDIPNWYFPYSVVVFIYFRFLSSCAVEHVIMESETPTNHLPNSVIHFSSGSLESSRGLLIQRFPCGSNRTYFALQLFSAAKGHCFR